MNDDLKIDFDRLKKLRETEGFYTARSMCYREAALKAIDDAKSVDDIKALLKVIVLNIRFDH